MKSKIILKELKPKDVSKKYVMWLKNKNIIKFTNVDKKQTLSSVKKYVEKKFRSKNEFLYAIYIKGDNKNQLVHIGNIKLGPIDLKNKISAISYFIGDTNLHNRGFCTAAIKRIIVISKKKFSLKKLKAGLIAKNIASKKVLLKNNFKLEGIFRSEKIINNRRYDSLWFGKLI